ncbi:sialic acid [Nesidiocoris tenuis]|uniref:Sialic acid n=1 Tax=Nesidiocoris tenuis TaxID=355587 RepID=A0ABN7BC81_9HEMI|nr:sialic acid [Nesidiocoris tenuis]
MPATIRIGRNTEICDASPCFIIAEIGQNHQGDVAVAQKLIDIAKDCGADCVKFQKSCLEEKFTRESLQRPYVGPNSWGSTYGEHKSRLELSCDDFKALQCHAKKIGIMFTASAMDPVSLDFLISLDVPFVKIGSGDSDNLPLIEEAAKSGKPLVISTGMQDLEGVKRVKDTVEHYHKNFAFLHCVSSYPTKAVDANLSAITTMKAEFPETVIGYSGHEEGFNISVAAAALGAKIIERHITLDKSMKGTDHACSLAPDELRQMIRNIREIESALGDGVKTIRKCEMPCFEKLGKTIVTSRDVKFGQILTAEDMKIKVAVKKGFLPHEFMELIGRTVNRDLTKDETLTRDDLG